MNNNLRLVLDTNVFLVSLIHLLAVLPLLLPAQPLTTNLPIVRIETDGREIPDEPKITAQVFITDNGPGQMNRLDDPPNIYAGFAGIERRGASSLWYPQPSYAIETREENGDELDISPFGWPKESDWTLITHFNDRALMRNLLSFHFFREMGHYAPRARLVEAVLNGDYRGIYLFCERIKRDKGRVDVAKLDEDEITGPELTGGYIIKVDYFSPQDSWQGAFEAAGRPVHYVYYYPKPEDIRPEQKSYIQAFMYNFESALYSQGFADPQTGYRKYIDVTSFIDYLIVQELSRNVDGFKKSSYFWKAKDSDGGLLHAGPVWDFDWAWKNINECFFGATDGSGFSYRVNDCGPDIPAPGWLPRMLQDTFFANRLRCRYDSLREGLLSEAQIFGFIDSVAQSVETAQVRHFDRWDILGVNTGAPEVPPIPATYAGEIEKLKTWIRLRLKWLDAYLPGQCGPAPPPDPSASPLRVWPNPAAGDEIYVQGRNTAQTHYALYDATGRNVRPLTPFPDSSGRIDVSGLPAGVYLLRVSWPDGAHGLNTVRFVVR